MIYMPLSVNYGHHPIEVIKVLNSGELSSVEYAQNSVERIVIICQRYGETYGNL